MSRGLPYWRIVATVLVALMASTASRWPHAVPRSCAARCPADCPMHAKKLKCHDAKGVSCHGAKGQGAKRRGLVLHAPGCTHRDSASTDGTILALPRTLPDLWPRFRVASLLAPTFRELDAPLEPPFRPPSVA